jgi:hypothetical protein
MPIPVLLLSLIAAGVAGAQARTLYAAPGAKEIIVWRDDRRTAKPTSSSRPTSIRPTRHASRRSSHRSCRLAGGQDRRRLLQYTIIVTTWKASGCRGAVPNGASTRRRRSKDGRG